MNVAIIGYGAIATAHGRVIQLLRRTPEWRQLRLTAVMGRLPEPTAAFAREFGAATTTTDLADILADPGVDAVIICSPSHLHASQAALALQAGKHVLCEIPVATSLADTDRLIRIAAAAKRC
ncbi:MAG: Gfo/Idh/MocA family protein, partial [Chloroflexota bacterium]